MRPLVSVDVDPPVDAIADAQDRLPDVESLRLVDPENAHVTPAGWTTHAGRRPSSGSPRTPAPTTRRSTGIRCSRGPTGKPRLQRDWQGRRGSDRTDERLSRTAVVCQHRWVRRTVPTSRRETVTTPRLGGPRHTGCGRLPPVEAALTPVFGHLRPEDGPLVVRVTPLGHPGKGLSYGLL
jgi:hypothetical protein